MPSCSVRNCKNSFAKGFLMKKFPRDATTRQSWIEVLSREDWTPSQHSCVCEAHFVMSDWSSEKYLNKNAIPSVFCNCPEPSKVRKPLAPKSTNVEHGYSVYAKAISTSVVRNEENASPFPDHEYGTNSAKKRRQPVHAPTCPMSSYVSRKDRHLTINEVAPTTTAVEGPNIPENAASAPESSPENDSHSQITPTTADRELSSAQKRSCPHEARCPSRLTSNDDAQSGCLMSSAVKLDQFSSTTDLTCDTTSEGCCVKAAKFQRIATSEAKSNIVLRQSNARLRKKLEHLEGRHRIEIEKMERQLKQKEEDYQSLELAVSKIEADQLRALQRKNMKGCKWSDQTVKNCLPLWIACGPTGYEAVSKTLLPMPTPRTLQRRIEHIKFRPGLLKDIFPYLQEKVDAMPDGFREVFLVFDEMAIQKGLNFDQSTSSMVGHCTLEGGSGLASKGLVFMIGGLQFRWKQVVAYHLTGGTAQPRSQKNVILDILEECHKIGLRVRGMTADMANRSVWQLFGVSCQKNNYSHCIDHPCMPGEKLFFMPDPVHLYKNIKEMLVNNRTIQLSPEIVEEFNLPSSVVDSAHIEQLVDLQDGAELQQTPKLSKADFKPGHFIKMKVRSAAAVLSDKTSAALIDASLTTGNAELQTTAWFVKLVNSWFKLMTARSGKLALRKPMKRASNPAESPTETGAQEAPEEMEVEEEPHAYDNALFILRTAIRVFETMSVGGQWKPAQSGLRMATMTVLDLQEVLLNKGNFIFFCPGLLTQDMVENLFSQIRLRRPVPQPLQFIHRLRQLTIAQFMQPIKSSSYDFDDRNYAIDLLHPREQRNVPAAESIAAAAAPPEDDVFQVFFPDQELTALYRMCGYILFKVKEEFKTCDTCVGAAQHTAEEPHPMSRFLHLTNFKENAQVEVADCVYQMLLQAEVIFRQQRQIIISGQEGVLGLLESKCSHLLHVCASLPQCHNISKKILSRYLSMRTRQLGGKVTSSLSDAEKAEGVFASKSTGSRYLANKFKL